MLSPIARAIVIEAGGLASLCKVVGDLLRSCFDGVVKTAKTGRRSYLELEKTEKTHIGTCVEIDFRTALELGRGKTLDLQIAGHEVDVKFTIAHAWMIPREAVDRICLLIKANEKRARFSIGLFVARPEYLCKPNQDKKRSTSAHGRRQILWLLDDVAYPQNFWQTISQGVIERIASGRSANERMVQLFREVRDRPIDRSVIEDVAGVGHKDFMRRIRADGKRGTRNILANEGIALLSGTSLKHQRFIRRVGLPAIERSQFISTQVKPGDKAKAHEAGFRIP